MCDFNRFEKIFGIDNSKRQTPIKTPTTTPSRKRKQRLLKNEPKKRKQAEEATFVLDISMNSKLRNESIVNRTMSPLARIQNLEPKFISPDKKPILEYLSCGVEEFVEEPLNVYDSDVSDGFQILPVEKHQEIFSPEIEEFSEGDDVFNMSQEGEQIININMEIMEVYQKKPKYKPMKKIPKPGGLMESLRAIKNKRLAQGCKYARNDASLSLNQRKIEVIESCDFRRRFLLKFKFADDFSLPDPEKDAQQHFLVVPPDFSKFIKKHRFYDVIFDFPEREFIKNQFVHFTKMIRAGRKF